MCRRYSPQSLPPPRSPPEGNRVTADATQNIDIGAAAAHLHGMIDAL